MKARCGFTLIELLVVVAIVAILSSIAVSNMGEASTRSKVAAVRSDLRVLSGALEAYATDHNAYPPSCGVGHYANPIGPFAHPVGVRLIPLTTPIGYISAVPADHFAMQKSLGGQGRDIYDTYDYVEANAIPAFGFGITSGGEWRIAESGPDLFLGVGGVLASAGTQNSHGVDYDATNGTASTGDLVRVGALAARYGDPLNPANERRPGIARAPIYAEQWQ
jgi:prepilin-type N-terminal cleavage/methylation domain-containing protein